jgi:Predicted nucleotide-binding protein containing TIR-like domain
MSLPLRATIDDVEKLCTYLAAKPTGATLAEAKTVLDPSSVDIRKMSAFRAWGLITADEATGKMRLTDRGRGVAKDKGARKAVFLRESISAVPAYMAIVQRAVLKGDFTVAATDVAAHWHQHYRAEVSENDEVINQQAICFFQLAEGCDLGRLIVGRKGQPTRFEFHEANARALFEGASDAGVDIQLDPDDGKAPSETPAGPPVANGVMAPAMSSLANGNRVFITHGKNKKVLEQIKRTVTSVGFEPVVSVQSETAAKPVPQKVMDDMRSCSAVVIHVGAEDDGKGNRLLNPNVLIEIGAAMMHCPNRFVLVVEEGIDVPSNLQGLYQSRYSGDSLDWDAGMKIQEALRGLRGAKV